MEIKYSRFFKIVAKHSFYEGNKCPVFTYQPTPECIKTMSANGLLCNVTDEGIEIWYDELQTDLKGSMNMLRDGNIHLPFVLQLKETYFLNYTNLPTENLSTKIYYFSNKSTHAFKEGDLSLNLLTKKDKVGDDDRVSFHSKMFSFNPVSSLLEENIEIRSPLGELVDPKHIVYQAKKNLYHIDLRNYTDGLYEIAINGKKSRMYICDNFDWKRPFGVIDIFFNKDVPKDFRLVSDAGLPVQQTYAYFFDARATFWKYYIMGDKLLELKKLAVTNGKSNAHFGGPVETAIADKPKALVFESETAIPLQEKPQTVFQLQHDFNPGTNKGKTVIAGLPYPGIDIIKKGQNTNTSAYISEMFIY